MVAIVPTIRNLLLAKDLMERHRLARPHAPFNLSNSIVCHAAAEHLPRKDGSVSTYALGIAAQQAHRFETKQS
jgi:DNA polymerase-3 subunit delta